VNFFLAVNLFRGFVGIPCLQEILAVLPCRETNYFMEKRIVLEPFVFEWPAFAPRAALRCLPAVALVLGIGLAIGHPATGMIAAGGAVSVGFGSFQRIGKSNTTPMLLAAVGMFLSTLLGTLARFSPLLLRSWLPSGAFSTVSSWRWARAHRGSACSPSARSLSSARIPSMSAVRPGVHP
jgi:hypothetical protein